MTSSSREQKTASLPRASRESPDQSVLAHWVETLGVKILAYAAGVVVAVLVARVLGPRERGIWSLAVLLTALLAQAADLGFSTSALFLMRNRPDRVRATIVMSTTLVMAVSILFALMLPALGSVIPLLREIPLEAVAIAGIAVPPVALLGLLRQLLTAHGDLTGANASVLCQLLLLPALLAAALLTGPPVAIWALCAYVAATMTALLFTSLRLMRRTLAGPYWDFRLMGTLLWLGLPSQLTSLALSLTYRSDLFLVSNWLGLGAAGVYSIGLTMSEMLRGVPETAQAIVVSRAASHDLSSQAAQVTRLTALLTALGGLALALAAPIIVPAAFGEAYRGATVVFACLVPGIVGLAVSYGVSPLLFLEGRIQVSAVAASAALAVLWAFALLAPGSLTLLKVAIASSLAYWTLAGIQLWHLVREDRIDLRALRPSFHEFAELLRPLGRRRRV